MTADPLTVLVIDDDFRVATVHVGFVEAVPGFRVVGQAHTAAEALELARLLNKLGGIGFPVPPNS